MVIVHIFVAPHSQVGKTTTVLSASRTSMVKADTVNTVLVDMNGVNKNLGEFYGYNQNDVINDRRDGSLPIRYYSIPDLHNCCLCVVNMNLENSVDMIFATLARIAQEKQASRLLVDTNARLERFLQEHIHPGGIINSYSNYPFPGDGRVIFWNHWTFAAASLLRVPSKEGYQGGIEKYIASNNNIVHVVNFSQYWRAGDVPIPADMRWFDTFLARPKIHNVWTKSRGDEVNNRQILNILRRDGNQNVKDGYATLVEKLLTLDNIPLNLVIPPKFDFLLAPIADWPGSVTNKIDYFDSKLSNHKHHKQASTYMNQINRILDEYCN